jgi:di/tricarboxylate transporter
MRLLFILAGSIGLGTIVVSSGLADVIADSIRDVSDSNVALVVVAFALATTVMTNLVTNAATASILTPVGIGIATKLGIDPVTVLALIGTCISFTFINPFSHQSNLMVMRPGGDTTQTFARFGVRSSSDRWSVSAPWPTYCCARSAIVSDTGDGPCGLGLRPGMCGCSTAGAGSVWG